MPSIIVAIDGTHAAAVSTKGLDVLSVSIGGTKVDEVFASIGFCGGKYPEKEPSTYLVWLSDLTIQPDQCISLSFVQGDETSRPGKTIEELFPNESRKTGEGLSMDEIFADVRSRPILRTHYSLEVNDSSGRKVVTEVTGEEHGFTFSFLWNWKHPERVSASLSSYTIDQLAAKEPSHSHYREYLTVGENVQLRIRA